MKYLGRSFDDANPEQRLYSDLEVFEAALFALRNTGVLVAGMLTGPHGHCALGAASMYCGGSMRGSIRSFQRIAKENDRFFFRVGPLALSLESPKRRRNRMYGWLQEQIQQIKARESSAFPAPGKTQDEARREIERRVLNNSSLVPNRKDVTP